jgi:hypothetical protein
MASIGVPLLPLVPHWIGGKASGGGGDRGGNVILTLTHQWRARFSASGVEASPRIGLQVNPPILSELLIARVARSDRPMIGCRSVRLWEGTRRE